MDNSEMSYFQKRLNKRLNDSEFQKEWNDMEYKQPYEKMMKFINSGELNSYLDFYGLILHSYDLEDSEKIRKMTFDALSSYNEKDGYIGCVNTFNDMYLGMLKHDIVKWSDFKKEVNIPEDEKKAIEILAVLNVEYDEEKIQQIVETIRR